MATSKTNTNPDKIFSSGITLKVQTVKKKFTSSPINFLSILKKDTSNKSEMGNKEKGGGE